jgi:hypothetical protein
MMTSEDVRTLSAWSTCAQVKVVPQGRPLFYSIIKIRDHTHNLLLQPNLHTKENISSNVPSSKSAETALYLTQFTKICSLLICARLININVKLQIWAESSFTVCDMRMLIMIFRCSCIVVKATAHASTYQ